MWIVYKSSWLQFIVCVVREVLVSACEMFCLICGPYTRSFSSLIFQVCTFAHPLTELHALQIHLGLVPGSFCIA